MRMQSFQKLATDWAYRCFGEKSATDKKVRNHRFLEEALELVQANGIPLHEASQIVSYVYGRPAGEPLQEVGGVMLTLAVLCSAHGIDMSDASNREMVRVLAKADEIKRKHDLKPRFESS